MKRTMPKVESKWAVILLIIVACIVSVLGRLEGKKKAEPSPTPTEEPTPYVTPSPEQAPEPTPELGIMSVRVWKTEDDKQDSTEESTVMPEIFDVSGYSEEVVETYTETKTLSDEEIIVNVVCGEAGLTGIDSLMQEEARIVLNTAAINGMTVYEIVAHRLPSGYYVWHPQYTTPEFTENFKTHYPEAYERVVQNVQIALNGEMEEPVPDDVIYADLVKHGSGVWKQYEVDTGWYQSTVYLCYR